MDGKVHRILLIEDNPADAKVIREALADARGCRFDVESARQLSEGLERLSQEGIEAVLLDLSLPESQDIETFNKLLLAAPYVPIVVLGSSNDGNFAMQAVDRGAQDYLLKDHLNSYSLTQALRNAIERKAAEEALFLEKERAQVTLNCIGDAVISTDISGNITFLNPVAERMTGWSREEALQRPFAEVLQIIDGATREPIHNPMELAIRHNKTVGLNPHCILIRRGGFESAIEDSIAPIHSRNGQVTGAVMVFHDVSETRALALRATHLAQHDFLTDLPNGRLLNDRITQAIALARRNGKQLAVLFVDLDGFKHINDSLGHEIGDKLLQSVAQRSLACVRGSDTVSRWGGDEFVVLLSEIENSEDPAISAAKLLTALSSTHFIAPHDLCVTASIGISVYPVDGQDAEVLIKSADTAMYRAKENGRNNYQFFKPDMHVRAVERQSLEAGLRRSLERKELVLHYQPQINLATGEIAGAEALLRWMHPDRGLVPPGQFVPIAEDCGLIVPITRWVLREACGQARAWMDAGLHPIPVAVNISTVDLRTKDFVEGVRGILKDTRLEPRYLELELTERVLLEDGKSAIPVLQALKALGVRLAVDDFGTGYSNLSYLRRLPFDTLKIGRSFVRDINVNADDVAIVSAVISIGNILGKRVVAEGIETREQLEFLQFQCCDEGQGHYFSPAVIAEHFSQLLKARKPDRRITSRKRKSLPVAN